MKRGMPPSTDVLEALSGCYVLAYNSGLKVHVASTHFSRAQIL